MIHVGMYRELDTAKRLNHSPIHTRNSYDIVFSDVSYIKIKSDKKLTDGIIKYILPDDIGSIYNSYSAHRVDFYGGPGIGTGRRTSIASVNYDTDDAHTPFRNISMHGPNDAIWTYDGAYKYCWLYIAMSFSIKHSYCDSSALNTLKFVSWEVTHIGDTVFVDSDLNKAENKEKFLNDIICKGMVQRAHL
jgi:hypothetical protein